MRSGASSTTSTIPANSIPMPPSQDILSSFDIHMLMLDGFDRLFQYFFAIFVLIYFFGHIFMYFIMFYWCLGGGNEGICSGQKKKSSSLVRNLIQK